MDNCAMFYKSLRTTALYHSAQLSIFIKIYKSEKRDLAAQIKIYKSILIRS